MSDKPYTDAELAEFDKLTNRLSSRNQTIRMNARLWELPRFITQHGREKCDAMFAVLKARDAAKGRKSD